MLSQGPFMVIVFSVHNKSLPKGVLESEGNVWVWNSIQGIQIVIFNFVQNIDIDTVDDLCNKESVVGYSEYSCWMQFHIYQTSR